MFHLVLEGSGRSQVVIGRSATTVAMTKSIDYSVLEAFRDAGTSLETNYQLWLQHIEKHQDTFFMIFQNPVPEIDSCSISRVESEAARVESIDRALHGSSGMAETIYEQPTNNILENTNF